MVSADVEKESSLSEREVRRIGVEKTLQKFAPEFYVQAKAFLLPDGQLVDGQGSPREQVSLAYLYCPSPERNDRCLLNPTNPDMRDHPALWREDIEHLSGPRVKPEILAAMLISPLYAPCEKSLTYQQQLGYIARSIDKDMQPLGGLTLRRNLRERQKYLRDAQKALGKFKESLPSPHNH